jgi:tripartite-type tricarboxylate transporter receptor subunit TctC
MQSNRSRGVAISSKKRSPVVELPTVAESGLSISESTRGVGHHVVESAKGDRQQAQCRLAEAPKSPHVSQHLAGDGSTPVGNTTEQFNAHIRSEITK